jgi:hypothetical protein
MIEKWIHIECIFKNKWGLKILAEINKAINENRMETPSDAFYDYSMSIAIRIDLIDRLLRRITSHLQIISKEIIKITEDNIFTQDKEGYVFYIDDDLKLDLLIDIDAFLFEINSCCELLGMYLFELYNALEISIDKGKVGITLARILREAGTDISWFRKLDDCRNFFIHTGAPYIAIDVTDDDNKNLIIMKENLKSFTDPNKYLTLTHLVQIREGFKVSLPVLQQHLIHSVSNAQK